MADGLLKGLTEAVAIAKKKQIGRKNKVKKIVTKQSRKSRTKD